MVEPTSQSITLQWISAIGSIVTPVLILILGAILTRATSHQEKILEIQAKLQDDRIEIYNTILEPYIIATMPKHLVDKEPKYGGKDPGIIAGEIIASPKFKNAEFKLLLIGSDEVVQTYNQIKKFIFKGKIDGSNESTKELLKLETKFILAIRKSVGNERSSISQGDAIWWFVKDADTVFPEKKKSTLKEKIINYFPFSKNKPK